MNYSIILLAFAYPWILFLTDGGSWSDDSLRAIAICMLLSLLFFILQLPRFIQLFLHRHAPKVILIALCITIVGNLFDFPQYARRHKGLIVSLATPWDSSQPKALRGVGDNPITIGLAAYYRSLREHTDNTVLIIPKTLDDLNPGNVRLFHSAYARNVAHVQRINRAAYTPHLSEQTFEKLRTRVRHEEVTIGDRQTIDFFLLRPRLGKPKELYAYRYNERFVWIDGRLRDRLSEEERGEK